MLIIGVNDLGNKVGVLNKDKNLCAIHNSLNSNIPDFISIINDIIKINLDEFEGK